MKSYHNTTNLKYVSLADAVKKATKQDKKILAFFKSNAGKMFSPCDIWTTLYDDSVPLTSIRRSMTNLTDEGLLMMTNTKKESIFGRPTHCWTLKGNNNDIDMFKL